MSRTQQNAALPPAHEAREAIKRFQSSTIGYLITHAGLTQGQIAAYVGCDHSRISRALNTREADILDSVHQWQLAQLASNFGCDDIANGHAAPGKVMQPLDMRVNGCTDDEVVDLTTFTGRASHLFKSGDYRTAKSLFAQAIAAAQRGKAECMMKLGLISGETLIGQATDLPGSARHAAKHTKPTRARAGFGAA